MNNFLNYIEKGLAGAVGYFAFSVDLEQYLVDHYDEMYSENPQATLYLNDVLPDETEKMEPGMDPAPFLNTVKEIVEKSKTM